MSNVVRITDGAPVNDVAIDMPPLSSGGGGGTYDGMEARVSKLEAGYEKLRDDIGGLKTEVAVLTERVRHLPSKGFIVTATATTLALLTAVIVFQERIVALLGTSAG